MAPSLAFLALLIELMLGYPDWLVRAVGHPVTWMGRAIAALDRAMNRAHDPAAPKTQGLAPLSPLPASGERYRAVPCGIPLPGGGSRASSRCSF